MNHFVTVFDRSFLPQFIALAMSFERHADDYTLWAFCVDRESLRIVKDLVLPNVAVVSWPDLESDEYRQARSSRSAGEYCWTLTARSIQTVMDRLGDEAVVTYVDADVWLVDSPKPIIDEFRASGAATAIMRHAFSPAYDKGRENGAYVVQLLPFAAALSRTILSDWEARCLASCSADTTDGHFGDQTYLDEWPRRYGSLVHELTRPQWVLAPWSMQRFPLSEAVAFHFHGLRLLPRGHVWLGDYPIPMRVYQRLYEPYLADLRTAAGRLKEVGAEPLPQATRPSALELLRRRLGARRRERSARRFRRLG